METAFVDACFPNNCPPLHTPCLLRVANLHWSRGCHDQADSWDGGNRGAYGPGRHVGGSAGVVLMEGTFIGSVSGEILISDGGKTATADDQYVPRAQEGLTCPIAPLFNRAGIAEAGVSDQL